MVQFELYVERMVQLELYIQMMVHLELYVHWMVHLKLYVERGGQIGTERAEGGIIGKVNQGMIYLKKVKNCVLPLKYVSCNMPANGWLLPMHIGNIYCKWLKFIILLIPLFKFLILSNLFRATNVYIFSTFYLTSLKSCTFSSTWFSHLHCVTQIFLTV
jgi:hypothetical protein